MRENKTMAHSPDLFKTAELDYERWTQVLRSLKGRYSPGGVDYKAFAGWARTRKIHGFEALDLSCNAQWIERTQRDVRLDDVDHYYAIFQAAGRSAMIQNDETVRLSAGD